METKPTFLMRFAGHESLKRDLQAAARLNNRSLHAEIITRLQQSFGSKQEKDKS